MRSELVVPLLLKDRCIGVFDLESPELGAFTQRHAEILGILASQAAVAIENARLYETVRASELRARARDRVRAPRAERADADRAAEAPERGRARGAIRAGAANRRRSVRLPLARPWLARHCGRRRSQGRGFLRRCTARSPASSCARAPSGGGSRRSGRAPRACSHR